MSSVLITRGEMTIHIEEVFGKIVGLYGAELLYKTPYKNSPPLLRMFIDKSAHNMSGGKGYCYNFYKEKKAHPEHLRVIPGTKKNTSVIEIPIEIADVTKLSQGSVKSFICSDTSGKEELISITIKLT